MAAGQRGPAEAEVRLESGALHPLPCAERPRQPGLSVCRVERQRPEVQPEPAAMPKAPPGFRLVVARLQPGPRAKQPGLEAPGWGKRALEPAQAGRLVPLR